MKHGFLRQLAGGLALISLGVCLAAPVLYFLGRMTEASYKTAFLIASIAWFILATARGMTGKNPAAG